MPPITPPQHQSSSQLLRELKSATAAVTKEKDELQAIQARAQELTQAVKQLEVDIDTARSQVYFLLTEQMRLYEILYADEYIAAIEKANEP
jgi:hypothetical protein